MILLVPDLHHLKPQPSIVRAIDMLNLFTEGLVHMQEYHLDGSSNYKCFDNFIEIFKNCDLYILMLFISGRTLMNF